MDPFFTIFVLFSPLWWLLFIAASGLIIWALEEENGLWATVVFVASILLMTFFGTMPTLDWFLAHQWTILTAIGAYFIAGAVWGYAIKWYFFCIAKREKYEDIKRHWLRNMGYPNEKTIPASMKDKWAEEIKRNHSDYFYWGPNREKIIQIETRYWDHKARTLRWAVYWPWSVLWSIFDDVIRNIFRHLQRFFSGIMEWISNFVFRGVADDFNSATFGLPKKPEDDSTDE